MKLGFYNKTQDPV